MKKLTEIFGVDEGQEFYIKLKDEMLEVKCIIEKNTLYCFKEKVKKESHFPINYIGAIESIEIIKNFTEDEKTILKNVEKKFQWIARDPVELYVYEEKPVKNVLKEQWEHYELHFSSTAELNAFKHLFKSIKWEDNKPVFIDDVVER
jgi:hypothetical protein